MWTLFRLAKTDLAIYNHKQKFNRSNLINRRNKYMEITSAVDLIVFAGQSNMAGRGDAEDAPECLPGAGYEYKAVSAPEDLIPIQEPFGLHEDRENGLSDRTEDGGTKRSGSMVTALVNEYYRQTGRVVV